MTQQLQDGICEVHQHALNDTGTRKVFWCDLCQAWICKECSPRLDLRAIAWAKRSIANARASAQASKDAVSKLLGW